MNRYRNTVLLAVAALAGIVVAAAITWGTSQLVRQHIGLASEPLTAGSSLTPPQARPGPALAPAATRSTRSAAHTPAAAPSAPARAAPVPAETPSSPVAPAVATPEPARTRSAPSTSTAAPGRAPERSARRRGEAGDRGEGGGERRDD
jgi:hypothetical protein